MKKMNNHPDWNESYYFNFYDESNDITAFMRIGNKPNKDEKSMFFFLINKGKVIGMRSTIPCDENRKECAGLKFSGPEGNVWNLTYTGYMAEMMNREAISQVSMDIQWTALNPEMDYRDCVDEKQAAMSSNVASEHYEQYGSAKGKITINGQEIEINAYGERDKSLGVRDWGSPEMWMWLNSVYNGEYGFNLSRLVVKEGAVNAGFFGSNDENDPIVGSEVELSYENGIPSGYDMVLKGKSGKEYPVKGEVMHSAFLPLEGSKKMMLIETISKTEWNGKTGYGIAEFLVPAKE